jgi:probable HAF family extracellular repeat protein
LGRWSEARAINNRGDVVGWSEAPDGYYHAVVWREGVLYNLNDLVAPGSGWLLVVANDINNSGDIVGGGYIDDELHAFLLTLDPRPAAAP